MKDSKRTTVVVGVDYSDAGNIAVRRAIELVETGTLHAIHVIETPPSGPMTGLPATPSLEIEAKKLHDYLVQQIPEGANAPLNASRRIVSHIALGAPAQQIAQLASDLEADLVIVGTHGRTGLSRLLLGSIAEGVLRLARCPVLVERSITYESKNDGPAIEPPCPRCLDARKATEGTELWCEQHRERHGRRHTYHSTERASAFPSGHPGLGSIS